MLSMGRSPYVNPLFAVFPVLYYPKPAQPYRRGEEILEAIGEAGEGMLVSENNPSWQNPTIQ